MESRVFWSLYVKKEIQCDFDKNLINHFSVPTGGANASRKRALEGV